MDNFLLKDSMPILNDLSLDVKALWKTKMKGIRHLVNQLELVVKIFITPILSIILITSFYSSSG